MTAIFKRELRAYFLSPLGYVFIGAIAFFSGYFFFTYNLFAGTTNMTLLYSQLFPVVLFLVPVLTMRLLSEDRHLKTDQLLFTAPVSRSAIVLGKYLSALLVFFIAIASTLVQAVVLSFFGRPDWPVVIGHFTGLFLLGGALIAICMFLSSLTESQFIAAISGFGVSLFLMLVDSVALVVSSPFLQQIFRGISFSQRYTPFTMGILDLPGAVFFLSIAALFVALSIAVLDKRRWG